MPPLPPSLQRLLGNATWQRDEIGMSSAQTYRIDGREPFYLKIDAVEPWGGLKTEAEALRWLRTYLPAPEVLYYDRVDGADYLLMRALPGLNAADEQWLTNPPRLAATLGEALRRLHALDPRTCPFDQRTPRKLEAAARTVRLGLVDEANFDDENDDRTPEGILEQLLAEQPADEDLVVTHGDFCPTNLILNDWKLSGFIDPDGLGVGDRYQDLALCTRELTDLFGTDRYNDHFYAVYGLHTVDEAKIRYFRLLDELN